MIKILPTANKKILLTAFLVIFFTGLSFMSAQSFSGSKIVNASNGMEISVTTYPTGDSVQVTMSGPSNVWFAFGFGRSFMTNTYCIVTDGAGNISERKLGNHSSGNLLPPSLTKSSYSIVNGVGTTKVTRTLMGLNADYFTFPGTASTVTLIWAYGTSSSFGSHINRGATTVSLTKNCKNVVDVSITQNGPQLSANNSGGTYRWLDCSNGNTIISGETNQSFTASMIGSYAVEITEAGCTDTSACFSINSIGLDELNFSDNITLYPSPTKGEVSVALGNYFQEITATLYDNTGKLVSEQSFKNVSAINLNVDGPAGIYVIHFSTTSGKSATAKILKS